MLSISFLVTENISKSILSSKGDVLRTISSKKHIELKKRSYFQIDLTLKIALTEYHVFKVNYHFGLMLTR